MEKPHPIQDSNPPPFDIIGDVHGCYEELTRLFMQMGYEHGQGLFLHRESRTPVFLGDITDRGPRSIDVLKTVVDMVAAGRGLYTPGNHCDKLARWLRGRDVKLQHGIETTVSEFEKLDTVEKEKLSLDFLTLFDNAPPYLILHGGRLVVAHAGIKEEYIGKFHKKIRRFILYGDITGETDKTGLPVRRNWALDYSGDPLIVYGHSPVKKAEFVNNTICLDGGCAVGGSLFALRYPEMEIVSVRAKQIYYPGRSFFSYAKNDRLF